MQRLAAFLHDFPALCLFLSILLGSFIGRFHFKGVGFGAVVGTLIAGILIGILARPELPDQLRWVFFYLFLFAIGYSVGPQFFGSLKKAAIPQIVLALAVAASGLAAVIGVSAIFGFNEGLAVGLLSGGMTQSAALGTGLSAIAELPIAEADKAKLIADAPLADAITYGFGDLGLILFLTWLGPKIMRADLKREAKALEAQLSGGASGGQLFSAAQFSMRAYRLERVDAAASTVAALEARFTGDRLSVHRVQRGDDLLTAGSGARAETGRSARGLRAPRRAPPGGAGHRTGDRRRRAVVRAGADGGRRRDQRRSERCNARSVGTGPERARGLPRVAPARHRVDPA